MRRLAAFGLGNRLHRRGPSPTRLENGPTDHGSADADELEPALRKNANVVRFSEALQLGSLHCGAMRHLGLGHGILLSVWNPVLPGASRVNGWVSADKCANSRMCFRIHKRLMSVG